MKFVNETWATLVLHSTNQNTYGPAEKVQKYAAECTSKKESSILFMMSFLVFGKAEPSDVSKVYSFLGSSLYSDSLCVVIGFEKEIIGS